MSAPGGAGYAGLIRTFTQVGPYTFQGIYVHDVTIGNEVRTVVPEPSTAALLGLGATALGLAARGRRSVGQLLRKS